LNRTAQDANKAGAWIALLVILASALLAQPLRAESGVFEPLTIVARDGRHDFQVEVMRSEEEQARGMMFRHSLAADHGMLFPFPAAKVASFWMENTYVSLDLIFIKADGTIHRIAERAEPLSTRSITSGEPVLAVLELLAGTAARLGLAPGDRVESASFRR
jgi:uncharacterized membrane protein (UPF0127 family)